MSMGVDGARVVAAGSAGLAVGVWLVWPSSGGRVLPAARSRGFVDFTVCVLTDARAVSDPAAAPVWQGVLAAQKVTNAKAQSFPTLGDGSVGAAVVSLDTLASRGCGLIVAVGASQVAAVFPQGHFVVVGGFALAEVANVAVVEDQAPDAVSAKVAVLARDAVAGRFSVGPVS